MTTIELLRDCGVELRVLELWVERGWIVPARAEEKLDFSHADAARAAFIRDLREDFGVNDEGVEIVLHLVDQLHGMRRALLSLRANLHTPDRRETGQ